MSRLSSTGIITPGCLCGLNHTLIKYEDILNCTFDENYTISYLKWHNNKATLKRRTLEIKSDGSFLGDSISQKILNRSYANLDLPNKRKPLLVIVNPHSGPGNALSQYKKHAAPVFEAAGLQTNVIVTSRRNEAHEIAAQVDIDLYDIIVCVSGDGLPHEVINGLASRSDSAEALKRISIAQLPGGSGNAMSLSLNNGFNQWELVAFGILKGQSEPFDIMKISQGDKTYFSFLSQSYGIVADCDLGTEDLRWMGGARFTVGIVMKCLAGNKYPCTIAYHLADGESNDFGTVNDEIPSSWAVETHHDLSMFYVGKMKYMSSDALVFPKSEPLDGSMDMLVWGVNDTGRITSLSHLLKFEEGTHVDHVPFYKKVDAYRLIPEVDGYLSIDGESYPCTPIQVSVVKGGARYMVYDRKHHSD